MIGLLAYNNGFNSRLPKELVHSRRDSALAVEAEVKDAGVKTVTELNWLNSLNAIAAELI